MARSAPRNIDIIYLQKEHRFLPKRKPPAGSSLLLGEPLTVTIDIPMATAALNRLQTEQVDGYDLFILESMKSHGVVQIITDDGDFATVPGIQVFTANRNVIRAARAQERLVIR